MIIVFILMISIKFTSPTASSRHTDSRATGCQYLDTIPYCRNSVPICILDEQAAIPYGTSCTAPEKLSCLPRNASSATSRFEWGRAAYPQAHRHLYTHRRGSTPCSKATGIAGWNSQTVGNLKTSSAPNFPNPSAENRTLSVLS